MKKYYFIIPLSFVLPLFFTSCEKLNSPDQYLQIPGKIQITRVTYDANYNYRIHMYWDNYQSQYTGYQLTRDSKLITNLSVGATEYIDEVQRGTYEYRLYAMKGFTLSLPSYIKIRVNTYDYNYWYQ